MIYVNDDNDNFVKFIEVLYVIGVKGVKRKKELYIFVLKKWYDGIVIVNNFLRF